MLIALVFSALSASAPFAADSVRVAPKSGASRADTTILSMPAPTIALPTQSAPEVVLPIRPVTSIATPRSSLPLSATPPAGTGVVQQAHATAVAGVAGAASKQQEAVTGSAAAASASTPTATPATTTPTPSPTPAPAAVPGTSSATSASSALPKTAPTAVSVAPTEPVPNATIDAKAVDSKPAATLASPLAAIAAPIPAPSRPATSETAATSAPSPTPASVSVRDSAAIKAPVAAPADAVAKVAAEPRALVTSTRIDPRTVVSVKSSERFEPLYAVPIPSAGIRLAAPAYADSIVVFKRERTLVLFNRGVPIRSYFIALGSKPVGDKERAGDQKTPEGLFYINAHNPASKFHLALRISYPSDAHRARAAALGVDPGGDIMIHGLPKEFSEAGKKHLQNDWTNGCVALSNQEIEEVWRAVPDGTPVQIKP